MIANQSQTARIGLHEIIKRLSGQTSIKPGCAGYGQATRPHKVTADFMTVKNKLLHIVSVGRYTSARSRTVNSSAITATTRHAFVPIIYFLAIILQTFVMLHGKGVMQPRDDPNFMPENEMVMPSYGGKMLPKSGVDTLMAHQGRDWHENSVSLIPPLTVSSRVEHGD